MVRLRNVAADNQGRAKGLAVKLDEIDGPWGKFMHDMLVSWHKSGRLIALEKKWNIPLSPYLAEMHEKYK